MVTLILFLFPILNLLAGNAETAEVEEKIECPKVLPKIPEISRAEVYKSTPFKAGESIEYEVKYGMLLAGYATLEVRSPRKHLGRWHRVFHGEARTGDWFKSIYVTQDIVEAVSRPWDFGISSFYLEQNEGKLFGNTIEQKKFLDFDHDKCQTTEKILAKGKPEEINKHDLAYGAVDSIGSVYLLRTKDFKIGQKERVLVYTSEKNWWLEAEPVSKEKLITPAGEFDSVKVRLQTFIGKELQQKGEIFAWFGTGKQKYLLKVDAAIKIGNLSMVIKSAK